MEFPKWRCEWSLLSMCLSVFKDPMTVSLSVYIFILRRPPELLLRGWRPVGEEGECGLQTLSMCSQLFVSLQFIFFSTPRAAAIHRGLRWISRHNKTIMDSSLPLRPDSRLPSTPGHSWELPLVVSYSTVTHSYWDLAVQVLPSVWPHFDLRSTREKIKLYLRIAPPVTAEQGWELKCERDRLR